MAVSTSKAAHRLLERLDSATNESGGPFRKSGAVLCFQVRHGAEVDRNGVAQDLKRAIFTVIRGDPPRRPVRFSVGLLPIDAEAFALWDDLVKKSEDHLTLAPLLIAFLSAGRLGTEVLMEYIEKVSGGDRLFAHLPWCGEAGGIVIPLTEPAVAALERRCLGQLLNGQARPL